MKLLPIAARNIRRNTKRTILSATATAVATSAILFLFAYIAGMERDYSWILSTYVSGHVRVRHQGFDDLEHLNPLHLRILDYQSVLNYLEADPRISRVSPRVNFPAMFYKADSDEHSGLRVTGVDFARERIGMHLEEHLIRGSIPEPGDRGVVLGPIMARDLGVDVGDTVTLLAQTMRRDTNAVSFTVRGIVAFPLGSMNSTTMLLPLDGAQRLARMGDSVSEILLTLHDDEQAVQVALDLPGGLAQAGLSTDQNPLSATQWKDVDVIYSFLGFARLIYSFVGAIFFILASTVLINTTMMVINERTREIGTIGALGMKGSEIVRLFFLEALIIAAIGSTAGIILGLGFVLPIQQVGMDLSSAIEGMDINIPNVLYTQFELGTTILIWLYAIAITSLTALLPSRRAAKILPVEALRYQG
jgi:putative ABC transport system permease protein